MSIFNPKSGSPVKNSSGSVKSGGDLSNLASAELSNQPKYSQTTKIVTKLAGTNSLVRGLHLGQDINQTEIHYNFKDYTVRTTDLSVLTGTGTNSGIYSIFTLSSAQTNTNSNFVWSVGKNPVENVVNTTSPMDPSLLTYGMTSYVGSASLDVRNIRGLSVFTGSVSPSGNLYHEKNINVTYTMGGMSVFNKTYPTSAWSKLNLNIPHHVDGVQLTVTGDPVNSFTLGKAKLLQNGSTLSRTVSVDAPISTPVTYIPSALVTLTEEEKYIKITSTDDFLMVFGEIDSNGNASPNVYSIIPSGKTLSYYPAYKKLGIATCIPIDYSLNYRTISVDIMK